MKSSSYDRKARRSEKLTNEESIGKKEGPERWCHVFE